ncbi:major facilitator superfamily domain-containing protein [Naematelia encephala]|uniref:Major facilitator superfamily domain-containing protein n=1 Tax=Naematelia encephala TaxID=71784 RepID=A0A1Y2BNT8_9TREE|nr:major facilitator superfamily domain-containing protein [Naematelia encephala]
MTHPSNHRHTGTDDELILPAPPVHDVGADLEAEREEKELEDEEEKERDIQVEVNGAGGDDDLTVDGRKKDIYDRFSKRQKILITAIVSYSAFLAPVTSSVFLPSIPQMAGDLHTTASMINVTVAIFLLSIGIAPLFWSPFAGFYGRKPVYLASMPIMVIASIGVAQSNTVGAIIGTRILQGIGISSVLAVGAGSIGDVYRPTERANAMGWFYSGALMGPSFSPLIAGLFSQYTKDTWRSTQYFLAGAGALSVLLTFFLLPETSHPPIPHNVLCEERGKKFVPYIFNPLSILGLFRWPNLCCVTFISACVMLETYCFIVSRNAFRAGNQDRYHITNVAVAGCLYIANGGGNFIGTRIGGPWADFMVKKYIKKRGYRRPEDRLRASLVGCGIIMPVSCLAYGWLVRSGAGGMAPPIVMMAISGVGLMTTLTPVNTYIVDCMQKRSAEAIAVNNFVRYVFAAAASAFVLPMADAIGWGWTMTFAAGVSLLSFATLVLVIRYGHKWREAADKAYGVPNSAPADTIAPENKLHQQSTGDSHSHHEREEAHHGEPGELVAAKKGVGKRPMIERSHSRRSMPGVEEVLSRTVSLSGASVHGGG